MQNTDQNLEQFKSFFPQFISALKNKDHEFIKKVYPGEFFKLMKGDETYDFETLGAEWIVSTFDTNDITYSCNGNQYIATHAEDTFQLNLVNGQWLGYDPIEAKAWLEKREKMSKFKYEYQISFAGFGAAKYQAFLNNAPIEELENYQIAHTISFVPFQIQMGENTLKISAQVDPTSSDYKQTEKQTITLSYEIFRFEKGKNDPEALFDPKNSLVKSGGPDSVSGMEEIQIGPEGFTREIKFNVE